MEVQGTNLGANGAQVDTYSSNNKRLFEVVDSKFNEKKIADVKVKNVSGRHIDRAELKIDDVYYFAYDINNDEEIIINTFSEKAIEEIEVISVDFDIKSSLYDNEITLEKVEIKDGVLKGSFKNNGQRSIYPSEIIYFVENLRGENEQRTISYASCFNDELVIKPGEKFEFEQEEKEILSKNKNVIVRYSDLDFREVYTVICNNK